MKVKRFTVANMQVGLKTISDTLGPEAVILSNRRLSEGLEIVAGVDEYEYQRFMESRPQPEESEDSDIIKANPNATQPLDKDTMQQLFSVMSDKNRRAFEGTSTQQPASLAAPKRQPQPQSAPPKVDTLERESARPKRPSPETQSIELLRQEIDGLRLLLKEQTEQLKEPSPTVEMSVQYERLEARFLSLGFSNSFTRRLLSHYDREDSLDANWRQLMSRISAALPAPLYDPLSAGGRFALVGPTGAGKTTTIAKLAAHAVKQQGVDAVAVVSMDWFQVGGQEILRSVTDILGVDFYPLTEEDSLDEVLSQLEHKALVLIDTSGSAEALKHWNRERATLSPRHALQTLLVAPATVTASVLNQFVRQMQAPSYHGVVLSKVDESACFGGAIEPILRHRWPLWYVTTGQNIPQDIESADGRALVKRLVQGLKQVDSVYADAS